MKSHRRSYSWSLSWFLRDETSKGLFSLDTLFPKDIAHDNSQGNSSFEMSSSACARAHINDEKTKGTFPCEILYDLCWENKKVQAREVVWEKICSSLLRMLDHQRVPPPVVFHWYPFKHVNGERWHGILGQKGYAKTTTNQPNRMSWSNQGMTGKIKVNGTADTAL